jgi:signal transduction histidine kinase
MRPVLFLFVLVYSLVSPAQKRGADFIDSVMALMPNAANDTVRARMYQAISNECFNTLPEKILYYNRAGLDLTTNMKWEKAIGSFNLTIGRYYQTVKIIYDSAIYYNRKAYDIFERNQLKQPANIALGNIGTLYQDIGNYTKAIEYYTISLKNAQEASDNMMIISNLCNIGLIQSQQKNYRESYVTFKKCLSIQQASNLPQKLSYTYNGLAICALNLKDTAAAVSYFKSAIKFSIDTKEDVMLGSSYANYAAIENDPVKKLQLLKKADALLSKLTPESVTNISNLSNIGSAYFEQAKKDSTAKNQEIFIQLAKKYFNRSLRLSEHINHKTYIALNNKLISEVDLYQNNYKLAYEKLQAATTLNDSIYSQENKNEIAEKLAQYELDKKTAAIQLKDTIIAGQKRQRIALVAGLVLLLVIVGLIYYQNYTRKKTYTTLMVLNNELDEANKVKAKFFGILSHDLRSPIANLVNFLQLQKRNPGILNEKQIADRESQITNAAASLLDTMESMLLWSKGQMESFKPETNPVAVTDLFAYIQKFFSDNRQIKFTFLDEEHLTIYSDENYLQTIMQNLTANAIKVLQQIPDAAIEWKAWKENNRVFLSITDNGPGISAEQAKNLFGETAVTGTKNGLGLHIIRDLARAIKCTITIAPRATSGGTSFILSL